MKSSTSSTSSVHRNRLKSPLISPLIGRLTSHLSRAIGICALTVFTFASLATNAAPAQSQTAPADPASASSFTGNNPFFPFPFPNFFPFPNPFPSPFPGLTPGASSGTEIQSAKMLDVESDGIGAEIYIPDTVKAYPGLLVVLHGCTQTGSDMAVGGRLNEAAEKYGFIALYPEQTYSANPLKCWNWFNTANQKREGGDEAQAIVELVKTQIAKFGIDPKKVIIAGFSAGGAMASNLAACYSDVFSGALVASGLEYAAATSESGARSAMSRGPSFSIEESAQRAYLCQEQRDSLIPIMVVHGSTDYLVNGINFQRTGQQFLMLNTEIARVMYGRAEVTEQEGEQIGNGLNATFLEAKVNGITVLKTFMVNGMGHAWSGGGNGSYMEPRGVDVPTLISEEFFNQ